MIIDKVIKELLLSIFSSVKITGLPIVDSILWKAIILISVCIAGLILGLIKGKKSISLFVASLVIVFIIWKNIPIIVITLLSLICLAVLFFVAKYISNRSHSSNALNESGTYVLSEPVIDTAKKDNRVYSNLYSLCRTNKFPLKVINNYNRDLRYIEIYKFNPKSGKIYGYIVMNHAKNGKYGEIYYPSREIWKLYNW